MINEDDFGPEYVVSVHDPQIGMRGFLVIQNTALGLGKGGIRMTPNVTVEEVYRLAETMTWKNALAGIPFGGAKAGIIWPPAAKALGDKPGGSEALKKKYVQSFARALAPFIPAKYVAGPDVSSGEKEMAWFADALNNFQAATGKPAKYCKAINGKKMCGLPHELGSTGFGVAHSTKVAAQLLGLDIKKATVAIEGFGNVGTFAFEFLAEMGAKIVAVADSRGAAYDPHGLDFQKLTEIKKKKGSVVHYNSKGITRDKFWGLPADILIPAAVTDAINQSNKNKIKAMLIVEGANIPMAESIEQEFHQKGILVVPDFVANAGGVISSYAEYKGFAPSKMFKLVQNKVSVATKEVIGISLKSKKDPREVGMELARAKVLKASQKRKSTF